MVSCPEFSFDATECGDILFFFFPPLSLTETVLPIVCITLEPPDAASQMYT